MSPPKSKTTRFEAMLRNWRGEALAVAGQVRDRRNDREGDRKERTLRYDFKCSSCGWKGERITKIADRDTQTCAETVTRPAPTETDPKATRIGPCGTVLTREEIALTARMAHFWQA